MCGQKHKFVQIVRGSQIYGMCATARIPLLEEIFLMEYQDKTLVCKDCGKEFIFSAGEQAFYAEKGFENEPVRCRDCREKRRRSRGEGGEQRKMYKVICAECGKETEVPFEPKNDRPVYCRDCFNKRHAQ